MKAAMASLGQSLRLQPPRRQGSPSALVGQVGGSPCRREARQVAPLQARGVGQVVLHGPAAI